MSAAGKVIIVTGASRGIGLAVAHYLLKQQCNLVVVARSASPLDKLRDEYPSQVETLAGDFADLSLGNKVVELATKTWGKIDGLVLNHGVLAPVTKIGDADAEDWRKAFDINVFSAVTLIKAALPSLRSSKGTIVMTSSGAASGYYTGWGAYGATKAVFNHMTGTLAVEEPEVTTIAIRPGKVDTEMQGHIRGDLGKGMSPKDVESFKKEHADGKLLRPDQPGNVIAKLAMGAPKELSGKYLSWNEEKLAAFQDS